MSQEQDCSDETTITDLKLVS